MRILGVFLAAGLIASNAFAAAADVPLAAGKPAGVEKATLAGSTGLVLLGLAVLGGGLALVVSQGNAGNTIATSTTGTAP